MPARKPKRKKPSTRKKKTGKPKPSRRGKSSASRRKKTSRRPVRKKRPSSGKTRARKPARRARKKAARRRRKAAPAKRAEAYSSKPPKERGPQFRILAHTADVGLEAAGPTLAKLFESAAAGFYALIVKADKIREQQPVAISIRAVDPEGLMVRFLQELNYMVQTQSLFGARVSVEDVTERTLTATLYGERYDAQRHRILREIKGVTYHRLNVRRMPSGRWRAEVYFDI
jgi:SHS2 domain-containing protein